MTVLRRYLAGVRLLGRGFGRYARSPRLLLLGLLPAAVTAVLFAGALVLLLALLGDLAAAATWFAADWPPVPRAAARVAAGAGIVGAALLVAVFTYTAVTLLLGSPCYDAIARHVEGEVPDEVPVGRWRGLGRSLADSARLLALASLAAAALFVAGLVPGLGQTVVPAAGVAAGGWLLALELVGPPFDRRGLRLADRSRALRTHLPETLGFGTAVFGCFLVPGGAVVVMPAAVAGGTLLARQVLASYHRARTA